MATYGLAFLIGVVAGLRSMTAPAAVSWAAALGMLHVENTWLSWLGASFTPYILTVLAAGELIADKRPNTPSRKAPVGFLGRLMTGALSGAALGATGGTLTGGLLAGMLGAVAGTLGGYECRTRLAKAIGGKDLPIALLEDGGRDRVCGADRVAILGKKLKARPVVQSYLGGGESVANSVPATRAKSTPANKRKSQRGVAIFCQSCL